MGTRDGENASGQAGAFRAARAVSRALMTYSADQLVPYEDLEADQMHVHDGGNH